MNCSSCKNKKAVNNLVNGENLCYECYQNKKNSCECGNRAVSITVNGVELCEKCVKAVLNHQQSICAHQFNTSPVSRFKHCVKCSYITR